MSWDNFELENNLSSEVINSGSGYYERESRFITLPKNEIYENGYGFYVSAKLAGKTSISIPDDLKVDLQMSPDARVPGKRYKRYKLTGKEIKEAVFFPYQQAQAEREKERENERQQRNKRVLGNIVYGHYMGNFYEGRADCMYDAFFWNGVRYYNPNHQKVQNVKVAFPIIEGVSKYFFDQSFDFISDRLDDYRNLQSGLQKSLETLKNIKKPTENIKNLMDQIEEMIEKETSGILSRLQADLAKALSEQKEE